MKKEHVNTQKKKNLEEILMSAIEGHEGTILNILCLIILIAWGLFELVIQKETPKLHSVLYQVRFLIYELINTFDDAWLLNLQNHSDLLF